MPAATPRMSWNGDGSCVTWHSPQITTTKSWVPWGTIAWSKLVTGNEHDWPGPSFFNTQLPPVTLATNSPAVVVFARNASPGPTFVTVKLKVCPPAVKFWNVG